MSQKEFLESWRQDFLTEIKRLFEEQTPKAFNIKNVKVDLTMTGKEAAMQYFLAYKGL